jgi:hypothetical protein
VEVLFLVWLRSPSRLKLCHSPIVAVAPFGGRQIPPAHSTGDEIVAAVSDDAEKSFVGIDDPTIKIPDEDADDVGINQPPYPRLPFL